MYRLLLSYICLIKKIRKTFNFKVYLIPLFLTTKNSKRSDKKNSKNRKIICLQKNINNNKNNYL